MPLDVVRLRDSDLAAMESPEACWAAVLLWCASWHQIPAASLPNDDRVLANLAGFGRVVKEWQKVKEGALRGWFECSDGRLYHPVIAEKANEAFSRKLEQAWRTECARIKKHNQRHPDNEQTTPTLEEYLSARHSTPRPDSVLKDKPASPEDVPRETPSNRQGEGQGHRDTEVTKGGGNSQSSAPGEAGQSAPPSGHATTTAADVCKALKAIGLARVNPGNLVLQTLIDAGATLEEFTGAAEDAKGKGKLDFSYVLGTVKGRREDAKQMAGKIATGALGVEKPWYITASGIEAKAQESGINTEGKIIPDYKAALFRQHGITMEMERKALQDFAGK